MSSGLQLIWNPKSGKCFATTVRYAGPKKGPPRWRANGPSQGELHEHPQAVVPKAVLRSAYGAACERAGRPTLTEKAFGQAFHPHRRAIEEKQRTVNGRLQWCYVGIGMPGEWYPIHRVHEIHSVFPILLSTLTAACWLAQRPGCASAAAA
jgi:hypothetical protein